MVYQLDDQAKPRAFAARMVAVIGNLDSATRTIRISDIIPALPPKVMHAKSVYLDCGACAGGLAKARQAALLEVQDWKRFDVVPDRRKADLIFQLSENRYLGDFDTGKGSVAVDATQMAVTAPSHGRNSMERLCALRLHARKPCGNSIDRQLQSGTAGAGGRPRPPATPRQSSRCQTWSQPGK